VPTAAVTTAVTAAVVSVTAVEAEAEPVQATKVMVEAAALVAAREERQAEAAAGAAAVAAAVAAVVEAETAAGQAGAAEEQVVVVETAGQAVALQEVVEAGWARVNLAPAVAAAAETRLAPQRPGAPQPAAPPPAAVANLSSTPCDVIRKLTYIPWTPPDPPGPIHSAQPRTDTDSTRTDPRGHAWSHLIGPINSPAQAPTSPTRPTLTKAYLVLGVPSTAHGPIHSPARTRARTHGHATRISEGVTTRW
jgi:hypothetical protein